MLKTIKARLIFQSVSEPDYKEEVLLPIEFVSEEEAEKFTLDFLGICVPIQKQGIWSITASVDVTKTDTETPQ